MLSMILNFLSGGVMDKIVQAYVARATSSTEIEKAEITASIEEVRLKLELLKLEQGNIVTRSVRPLFAIPFILYTWKLIIWDKLLGWGVTDPLGQELTTLMWVIVGAFFVTRPFEKRR